MVKRPGSKPAEVEMIKKGDSGDGDEGRDQ